MWEANESKQTEGRKHSINEEPARGKHLKWERVRRSPGNERWVWLRCCGREKESWQSKPGQRATWAGVAPCGLWWESIRRHQEFSFYEGWLVRNSRITYSHEVLTRWFLQFFLRVFLFFGCGPFLKSLLNLLQHRFCFMLWFFRCEAYEILAAYHSKNQQSQKLVLWKDK